MKPTVRKFVLVYRRHQIRVGRFLAGLGLPEYTILEKGKTGGFQELLEAPLSGSFSILGQRTKSATIDGYGRTYLIKPDKPEIPNIK
ncbi:MAG: hypothetical protein ACE5IY_08955 [bacterium]